MNKILLLFILIFIVIKTHAQTERWVWFASDEGNNLYYDNSTMTGSTDYPVIWVKTAYIKDKYYNNKKLDYRLDKLQLFCSDRKVSSLGSYYYFLYDSSPETAPLPGGFEESIIPGSIGKVLYNLICHNKK